ncbi:MAG TPA: polysaccharide deacetylase family protein [Candidatus Acidoferrum sp.]|jgi:peptidoglycan/xylan/chitin deacetylase (PgdA/CDA1 family)|nr:polysaccharide deacetylase family protein [Candidatus Acidoferrum sp.]
MYHDVGCEPEDRGTISADELAAQWSWLVRRGYRNVSLDQVGRELAAGKLEGGRRFAITFDDGRAGVYRNALPLLQSFGFTATVYVVPGFLGQTRWFSYRRTPASWVTEEEGGLRLTYMSLEETRRWMAAGQSVGSHSMTHQHLTCLGDAELEREIFDSARRLESEFGVECDHFAYPYGEYNRHVQGRVAALHATAVTVEQGPLRITSPLLALPRVDPGRRCDEMILRFARLGLL